MTTTRKPPLTRRMVECLRAVAVEAEQSMAEQDADDTKRAVVAGTEWIARLCEWYESTHPAGQ